MNRISQNTSLSPPAFSKRDTNICKGIAILMMYVHHLFRLPDYEGMKYVALRLLSSDQLTGLAVSCKLCVAVFVFLTAYGTTLSYTKRQSAAPAPIDAFSYSVGRYLRMMPSYWVLYVDILLLGTFTPLSRGAVYGEEPLPALFYGFLDAMGLSFAADTPRYNNTWWYMSVAVMLVFLMPLLINLVRKVGWSAFILAILIPTLSQLDMGAYFLRYLPLVIVGILTADNHLFERVWLFFQRGKGYRLLYWLAFPVLLLFVAAGMRLTLLVGLQYLLEPFLILALALFVYLFLGSVPVVSHILVFLGVHSMNLFLIHSFVRHYYAMNFTYSFGEPLIILLVLLADTLPLAICLDAETKLLTRFWNRIKAAVAKKPPENA